MDSPKFTQLTRKGGKKIWTEEEDQVLLRIIKGFPHLNWNETAKRLQKESGIQKTGKQCRERYRNYADPQLDKCPWKPHEKLLFLVLQRLYDNQWCTMSRYLIHRSDIAIKNYYYSTVRKTLKYFKTRQVPCTVLERPAKFYQTYHALDILRKEYLPFLNGTKPVEQSVHKEKIIIKLINDRNATEGELTKYLDFMLSKFKELHSSQPLPMEIVVNLQECEVMNEDAEEIVPKEYLCNTPPLNEVILLRIARTNIPEPPQLKLPIRLPNIRHLSYGPSRINSLCVPYKPPINMGHPLWTPPCFLPTSYYAPRPYFAMRPMLSHPYPMVHSLVGMRPEPEPVIEPEKKRKREF